MDIIDRDERTILLDKSKVFPLRCTKSSLEQHFLFTTTLKLPGISELHLFHVANSSFRRVLKIMERRRPFEKDTYSDSSDSEIEREEFDAQKSKKYETSFEIINRKREVIVREMDKIEEEIKNLYNSREGLERESKSLSKEMDSILDKYDGDDSLHIGRYNRQAMKMNEHNNLLKEHNRKVNNYNSAVDQLDARLTIFNKDAHVHNKYRSKGINRVPRIEEHLPQMDKSWKCNLLTWEVEE